MRFSVAEISSPELKRQFIDLPNLIYDHNNNHFVYPLRFEIEDKISPRRNPFFKYGKVQLFGVLDEQNSMVGRVAAIINPYHEKIHREKAGFFGMLETINDKQVISMLVNRVKTFLKKEGCSKLFGPVNFTTNDESGILIEGFNYSASLLCAYNEKYYPGLLEYCHFSKAVDMLAYIGLVEHMYPEKYDRIINRIENNRDVIIRTFEKKKKEDDIRIICDLYNECFKNVWGYVPLTIDEASEMAKKFLTFYDPELIWIVFVKGEPAGFILGLPDINQILKNLKGRLFPIGIVKLYMNKNKIDSIRVLAMGVAPAFRNIGIECLLINKIHKRMREKIYRSGEFSFVMENNVRMRRVLENLGFRVYKRYRIYETDI